MSGRITAGTLLLSLVLVTGCVRREPAAYDPPAARAAIAGALPAGWSVATPEEAQRAYTERHFDPADVDPVMLLGPRPSAITLQVDTADEHVEPYGRECLWVWLGPGDARPRFAFPPDPFAGPGPKLVFASRGLRVYGMPARADDEAADREINRRIAYEGVDFETHLINPSWATWKTDIAASIAR